MQENIVFVTNLIQISHGHVDVDSTQRVLTHLSCELCCGLTGVSTFVKLWLVVVDVVDVDPYLCCGTCMDPMDIQISFSGLKKI